MIARWVGRLFRVAAKLSPNEASEDLARVGDELVRLDRPPAQRPVTLR